MTSETRANEQRKRAKLAYEDRHFSDAAELYSSAEHNFNLAGKPKWAFYAWSRRVQALADHVGEGKSEVAEELARGLTMYATYQHDGAYVYNWKRRRRLLYDLMARLRAEGDYIAAYEAGEQLLRFVEEGQDVAFTDRASLLIWRSEVYGLLCRQRRLTASIAEIAALYEEQAELAAPPSDWEMSSSLARRVERHHCLMASQAAKFRGFASLGDPPRAEEFSRAAAELHRAIDL